MSHVDHNPGVRTLNDIIKLEFLVNTKSCYSIQISCEMQVSSSENLQTIESVPGSLLAGAGKMVGTIHEVKVVT